MDLQKINDLIDLANRIGQASQNLNGLGSATNLNDAAGAVCWLILVEAKKLKEQK